MKSDIAIQVENLSKVFHLRQPRVDENGNESHEHWALKDVSFEIKKGESVGIIGPNGSGKSTLLQILAGVTKPTSGKVTIRGKVASILDIGAGFHPELSGRENVYLNGQIHGFTKKEIEEKFEEILAFSGIEKFIDEPVKNYSNGMYLRLAFSIMAHLDFDVYLLDEVLSVGDADFQLKSKERISALIDIKKTIINVSHMTSLLRFNSQKIIYLKNGSIEKIGDLQILNDYENIRFEHFKITSYPFYNFKEIINSGENFLINNYNLDNFKFEETGISNQHSFEISILIQLMKDILIEIGLKLFDDKGNFISLLTSRQTVAMDSIGNYKISFEIPEKLLLSNTIYYFDLIIAKDNAIELKSEEFLIIRTSKNKVVDNSELLGKSLISLPYKVKTERI